MEYYIDLKGIRTKKGLHEKLKEVLPLPDYYGANLDAFYDVLSEYGRDWKLVFEHTEEFERACPVYYSNLKKLCARVQQESGICEFSFNRQQIK